MGIRAAVDEFLLYCAVERRLSENALLRYEAVARPTSERFALPQMPRHAIVNPATMIVSAGPRLAKKMGANPAPTIIAAAVIARRGACGKSFSTSPQIAVVGYHCMVPNFYYRQGKVRLAVFGEDGRMKSFAALPAQEQQRILARRRSLTDEMVVEDVNSVLAFFKTRSGMPPKLVDLWIAVPHEHALSSLQPGRRWSCKSTPAIVAA